MPSSSLPAATPAGGTDRICRRVSWELLAALAIQLLMIIPVLRTGYLADDQINSLTRGALHTEHLSWWQLSTNISRGWIDGPGRWFPVGWYTGYGQWDLIHSLLLYKWTLVGYALVASLALWWLMRELGANRAVAALVVVIASVVMQFRIYYDPHLSFNGLTQTVMVELALALICYQRWLLRGRWTWLVGSIVFSVIGASTYEAVYLFAPLFIFLAIRERHSVRAIVRASISPVLVMLVFVVLAGYLRAHGTDGAAGPYAPVFNVKEYLDTFVDQFTGAIPLTYAHFDPTKLFTAISVLSAGFYDVLVGVAAFAVTWLLLLRTRWERWSPLTTGALGLVLWLIVSGTLALARRYQAELVIGIADVPVYFEEIAFGITLVSLGGLAYRILPFALTPPRGRALAGVVALGVGLVATFQHHANQVVVASVLPARQFRILEDKALRAGLLDSMPNGSQLYVPSQPWRMVAYYWMEAGKTLDVQYDELVAAGTAKPPSRTCALSRPTGSASLQVNQSTEHINTGLVAIGCVRPSDHAMVYLRNADPRTTWLSGSRFDGTPFLAHPATLLKPAAHGLWTPRQPSQINVQTLLIAPAPGVPALSTTPGCYPDEGGNLRWCQQDASISVLGRPGERIAVSFSLAVADVRAHLRVNEPGGPTQIFPARAGTTITQDATIDAEGSATVHLRYDGPRFRAPKDPRRLYVRLSGLRTTPR